LSSPRTPTLGSSRRALICGRHLEDASQGDLVGGENPGIAGMREERVIAGGPISGRPAGCGSPRPGHGRRAVG
jgi:hypothetical protein